MFPVLPAYFVDASSVITCGFLVMNAIGLKHKGQSRRNRETDKIIHLLWVGAQ